MASPSRLLAALASAAAVLLLSGPGLGRASFLPEEAARVAAPRSPWHVALTGGTKAGLAPETAARLPSLVLAALTALVVSLAAGTGPSAPLVAALHPGVHLAARSASPAALQMALVAVALLLWRWPGRAARVAGVLLIALAGGAIAPGVTGRPPSPALGFAVGAWGTLLGEGLPPWRLDVALPVLLLVASLAWLGLGTRPARRTLALGALLVGGGLLGALAPRPLAAAQAAAPLVPLVVVAVARGSRALGGPASPGRALAVAFALMAGGVGIADLHLGQDVLDPARRVPWDEAARMTAVLVEADTLVLGAPDVPASLPLYAAPLKQAVAAPAARPEALRTAPRVLVVAHGERGGLAWPSFRLEESLEREGLRLRGELQFGPTETGLAQLLRMSGGGEAPPSFLRVRRYER